MSTARTEPTKRILIVTYLALMVLLGISAWAAFWPLGSVWNLLLALTIAAAKTTLVFLIFMQLRYQRGLIRLAALTGLLWLCIAGVLTFCDYLTRNWHFHG
jgi:cytochrome c oxidase subunit IV